MQKFWNALWLSNLFPPPPHPWLTDQHSTVHRHSTFHSPLQLLHSQDSRLRPCLPLSPFPFPLSSFPNRLRKHFPPIQSVLGEMKVRIYSQSQTLFFLSNGGDWRQKLSGFSVNLCLSAGYSTINWFASGYFLGG